MGSSQSSTSGVAPTPTTAPALDKLEQQSTTTTTTTDESSTISNHNDDTTSHTTTTKNKPKRTGMDLVNHKCRKKKAAYDKCVSVFYREQFLAGKAIHQEEECGTLFDSYRQCYLKHLKREFFDNKNKTPKEGSILAEEDL